MPKQGLCRSSVIQAAIEMIEEKGLSQFSMGNLARQLNIKTSSLYNHVESMGKLLEEVGMEAVARLVNAEEEAIKGKTGDEALFALTEAYRTFARTHYHLYQMIMNFPQWENPALEQQAGATVEPILRVLSHYNLTETSQFHWQRILRAVMVGFAFHERAGGFSHFPADENESYRLAIQWIAAGLRQDRRKTE